MTRSARRSARSVNRRLIGPASSPRSPRRRGALQTARDDDVSGAGCRWPRLTSYLLTGCGGVRRGLAVDGHTTRRAPQLRTRPHRRIDVGDLERSTNASTDARVADPANANAPGANSQRGIKRRGRLRIGGGAPWAISRGSSASWARGRRRYEPARPRPAVHRARRRTSRRELEPTTPPAPRHERRVQHIHRPLTANHSRLPRPSASPGEHPHRRPGQQR